MVNRRRNRRSALYRRRPRHCQGWAV